MPDGRRFAIVILLVLLAGAALLMTLPHSAGGARLAGMSLTWWYAAVLAPALAVTVAGVTLARSPASGGLSALAVCASPAALSALGALAFAGEPGSAVVALAALAAPLLAWLAPPVPAGGPARWVEAGAVGVSVTLLLGANLSFAADAACAAGAERWHGLVLAVVLVLGATLLGSARVGPTALGLGLAGLAIMLTTAAVSAAVAPWTAWSGLAARPSLVFGEHSRWTSQGDRIVVPTRLTFGEPQRVTALTDGQWHVVERDGNDPVIREWRLQPGDALVMRPGDELALPAGARVRFEAGRRVPGAPLSGVTWADAGHGGLLGAVGPPLGAALSLIGGTALLVSGAAARGPRATSGPALALLAAPVALWCGVYAAYLAPDLVLGAPAGAFLARFPALALTTLGRFVLGLTVAAALAALLVASSVALRACLDTAWRREGWAWLAVVASGALVAAWSADPWRLLMLGFGLAAVVTAAAIASRAPRAQLLGSLAGAVVFAGLTLAGTRLVAVAPTVAAYPALVAAPLAWGVAWLGDAESGRHR